MRALGVAASEGACMHFLRACTYIARRATVASATSLPHRHSVRAARLSNGQSARQRERERMPAYAASHREAISMTGLRVSFTRRALRRRNELRARAREREREGASERG